MRYALTVCVFCIGWSLVDFSIAIPSTCFPRRQRLSGFESASCRRLGEGNALVDTTHILSVITWDLLAEMGVGRSSSKPLFVKAMLIYSPGRNCPSTLSGKHLEGRHACISVSCSSYSLRAPQTRHREPIAHYALLRVSRLRS